MFLSDVDLLTIAESRAQIQPFGCPRILPNPLMLSEAHDVGKSFSESHRTQTPDWRGVG